MLMHAIKQLTKFLVVASVCFNAPALQAESEWFVQHPVRTDANGETELPAYASEKWTTTTLASGQRQIEFDTRLSLSSLESNKSFSQPRPTSWKPI